ncbi:MAG: bifunctional 3-deoxy-7-phosphoheptulonate synthase/chorismate mutase [Candidatus Eiseniibacteriota bacterium]
MAPKGRGTLDRLSRLRGDVDRLNREILDLVQERAEIVRLIARYKEEHGVAAYDPTREEAMLRDVLRESRGPFHVAEIRAVFSAIFRASLQLQQRERSGRGVIRDAAVTPVRVGPVTVGGAEQVLFFGPCAVESAEQIEAVAALAPELGVPAILRGGAYKPRTDPDSFQGLREEGVRLLCAAGRKFGLPVVTEVLDVTTLEAVAAQVDMVQVGARSMYNTELLKALGRMRIPVLLKRAFMASLDEMASAVGYLRAGGNESVVLCERGIRTFDYRTRNTLDVAAVPLLRAELELPVIVDVSHAVGRTDILLPCARAALAAGADGLMFEVHPDPARALSDAIQQIDAGEFLDLVRALPLPAAREQATSAPA